MIKILLSILNFLGSIITFIINTFTSLISLIAKIPVYIAWLVEAVAILPAVLIPFILASISVYAILFILGRTSS